MLHVITDLAQYSVKHFQHVISDDNFSFVLNLRFTGVQFGEVCVSESSPYLNVHTLDPHTSSYHSYLKPLTWSEHWMNGWKTWSQASVPHASTPRVLAVERYGQPLALNTEGKQKPLVTYMYSSNPESKNQPPFFHVSHRFSNNWCFLRYKSI